MKKKMIYKPPSVVIQRVAMEESIAQVAISARVTLKDWVDEGTVVGSEPAIEGGDVSLFD